MNTITLSYSDAAGTKGYKMAPEGAGRQVLKPGVLPGQYGFPDLHIVHLKREMPGGDLLLVITVTDHVLDEAGREAVLDGAGDFLQQSNL